MVGRHGGPQTSARPPLIIHSVFLPSVFGLFSLLGVGERGIPARPGLKEEFA